MIAGTVYYTWRRYRMFWKFYFVGVVVEKDLRLSTISLGKNSIPVPMPMCSF